MNNPALPVLDNQVASGASSRGSHQLAAANQCARKWMLRYRKRIIPTAEPPYRLGGTLIHDALAHVYAEKLIAAGNPAPSWWTGESIDAALQRSGEGSPDLIQCAREVYDAYPKYWFDLQNEPWEPVSVEEEYRATLAELDPEGLDGEYDDEVVTCGTDLIVRHIPSGVLWVVDHKTKSGSWRNNGKLDTWNPNGEYAVSWQACVNLHILRKRFPHDTVQGFIVNRVTRKAPFDFDRHVLHMSPRVYASAPRTMRFAAKREAEIDGMIDAGIPPVPAYWECYGRYGECDYRKLCNADTVDDMNAILALHYKSR